MADAGDLEKLPPEIRNEIYALVLVQLEPLALCKFKGDSHIGVGERNNRSYRASRTKIEGTRSDKPQASNVALLCVNKKIHMEAAPVLYSRTKFRFKEANNMLRFLNSIGNNIQYLCHVGIYAYGWPYRGGLRGARHAIKALSAAKSMHTFEVTHVDICPNMSTKMRKAYPGSREVVKICKPLLESLKTSYETNGLKASILEVIKVDIANDGEFELVHEDCGCETKQAIKDKAELERKLKRLVAEQHHLEFDA